MRKHFLSILAGLVLASSLFMASSSADELPVQRNLYVGGWLGAGIETNYSKDSLFAQGARIGMTFAPSDANAFIGGLYVLSGRSSFNPFSLTGSFAMTQLGVELIGRRLGGTGAYAGARFGFAVFSKSTGDDLWTMRSATGTSWNAGLCAGYEHPIINDVMLLAEVFAHTSGTPTMTGSLATAVPSITRLDLLVGMNVYF